MALCSLGIAVAPSPAWLILCLALLLAGCQQSEIARMDLNNAKPKLDLRRVRYDKQGLLVDEHSHNHAIVFADDWELILAPISGERVKQQVRLCESSISKGHDLESLEPIENATQQLVAYRFAFGVQNNHQVERCTYLINLNDYWLLGETFARDYDKPFDLQESDRFVLSLRRHDQVQADMMVLPAWEEYQQTRTSGSPHAKFIIGMDPAPVCLGNYQQAMAMADSGKWDSFTHEEHEHGGRMIGEQLLEFYTLPDPVSIRFDIWIDPAFQPGPEHRRIYGNTLKVASSPLNIWSLAEPKTFVISPGTYDVEIYVVHAGKEDVRILSDRERFARDDLERYEINFLRLAK